MIGKQDKQRLPRKMHISPIIFRETHKIWKTSSKTLTSFSSVVPNFFTHACGTRRRIQKIWNKIHGTEFLVSIFLSNFLSYNYLKRSPIQHIFFSKRICLTYFGRHTFTPYNWRGGDAPSFQLSPKSKSGEALRQKYFL